MTRAAPLAAFAAVLGVLGGWEGLAALEASGTARRVAARLAPLLRAGRDGRAPTPPERRRLALLSAAVLLAGGWIVAGPLAGAAVAAAGPYGAGALVRRRRRRHEAAVARAAPAVARALADALGAGHSVRGAIDQAARGVEGPAGAELRLAASALAMGAGTDEVVERLRRRAPGRTMDTIVTAILLQRDSGGDLARLLRDVAATHEDAQRLEGDARAMTAQARFTGLLVCLLPVGAAGLAELARPGYLGSLLRSPLTGWLTVAAGVLQVGALLAIRRLARVKG